MTTPATPTVRGRFITIEGPEGAGKTTQAERLAAAWRASGTEVVLTREPGGTRLGERVRALLLAGGAGAIGPMADAFLFNAARAQLVDEVLAPALAEGRTVICARFADSTLAYQGHGAGVPLDVLRSLAATATRGIVPDLTILLDVDPERGLARKDAADRTRFESAFNLDFHRRVRAGFLSLAAVEPARFVVIDAGRDADAVYAAIVDAVADRFAVPQRSGAQARGKPSSPPMRIPG